MTRLLLIGCGGFLGSVARYLLSGLVQTAARTFSFPLGTLAVNVLGCLVIGFLAFLTETRGFLSDQTRSFLFVGVLGGFTTFSTFANESMNLTQDGESFYALVNIALHIVLGLGAVWLGRTLAFALWR